MVDRPLKWLTVKYFWKHIDNHCGGQDHP